jgi:hypothetical protein
LRAATCANSTSLLEARFDAEEEDGSISRPSLVLTLAEKSDA